MSSPAPAPATPHGPRAARAWAEVFHILDFDQLPADGRVTSLSQIRPQPAAIWIDRWLPHYQGPEDLVSVDEFERRLRAALQASSKEEAP